MLADLEGADRVDQIPQAWFKCWTESTLEGGRYTAASDMQLVGRLMSIVFKSAPGQDLQLLLTQSDAKLRPSAAGALAHPWFTSTEGV